jgi:transcriptional regulator with GAF, ATPase, and Fis domain
MTVHGILWFEPALPVAVRGRISRALEDVGVEPADEDGAGYGAAFYARATSDVVASVRRLAMQCPQRLVVVAATADTLADVDAWGLLGAGAADVFAWGHSATPASEIAARFRRWAEIDDLLRGDRVTGTIVGRSPSMCATLREVVEAARFSDSNILLTGESGTGKELVAHLIHHLDRRRAKGPFVTVDCTTIVPTLSGSEFFGHERGAFTGAFTARDGAFARADGGTLFLDEVGELAPSLQAELLRVVQEGTYKRVGGNTWQRTRFRLIAATHRDLAADAAADRFRQDFLYRIASWQCHLPAMRERREDIPALAHHFLTALCDPAPPLDPAVARYLSRRDYQGNVRELKHLVERIGRLHVGPGPITLGDLPPDERTMPPATEPDDGALPAAVRSVLRHGAGLRDIREAATQLAVEVALEEAGGNLRRASERLGVTPRALQLRAARTTRHGHRTQSGQSCARATNPG